MSANYFFIIGAMKAGTTSLYKYLADHPDLHASPRKEPRVFRDPRDAAQLRSTFLALFEGRRHESWCFEGSTAYTKYPSVSGVPDRIRTVVPDARFVYLVRNPVERVWSQYLHNLAQGRETRPFDRAIEEDPQYLDISRYHWQLMQYLQVFPRERILVQVFEEMVKDPLQTVRAVCEFLNVDSSYVPPSRGVTFNASQSKLAATSTLRLIRRFGVEGVVPCRMRRRLKQRGAALPTREAGLPQDVRRRAVDALCYDTEAFFRLFGRRITAWSDFA